MPPQAKDSIATVVAATRRPVWAYAVRVCLVIGLAAGAGWQLWPYASWAPATLATHARLTDDAFFYSVLARNFHQYGFMTMDGEMPTNGYQPLWMWVQLGLSYLMPSTDTAVLLCRSSWVAYVGFAALAMWFVTRGALVGATLRGILLAGLVVNNTAFQRLVVAGLEVPMTLALVVGLMLLIRRYQERQVAGMTSRRDTMWTIGLGVLGAMVFFGRTDLFWLAGAVLIWLTVTSDRRWRTAALYSTTVGCMVVPYVAYNLIVHGSPMPISGRVKLYYMNLFLPTWEGYFKSKEWHGLFSAFENVLPAMPWRVLVGCVIGIVVVVQVAIWIPRIRRRLPTPLWLMLMALGCHMVFMYGAYRELRVYTAYYFAPMVVLTSMLLAYAITLGLVERQSPRAWLRYGWRTVGVALVAAAIWPHHGDWRPPEPKPSKYWAARVGFAQTVPKLVPDAKRIGAFWPGAVAQFSGLPTVPMDGVIGSNAYFQDYVKTKREIDYLIEHDVRYVVSYIRHEAVRKLITGKVPAMWSWAGMIRLWENQPRLRLIARDTLDTGGLWSLAEVLGDPLPARR